jgi:hypothetical protein
MFHTSKKPFMKKTLIISLAILIFTTTLQASPGNKLILLFNKTFPTAENVKWHEDANGYMVFFKMNGITNRIWYDTKEEFVSQERYYDEKSLPAYILIAVKKNYPGKQIFGVTESINNSSTYYQIILQDDKKLYYLKASSNGSIQLEKTYISASTD